ncbi:MAG: glycosyltransferase, partial [Pseudomonadota bacterium]
MPAALSPTPAPAPAPAPAPVPVEAPGWGLGRADLASDPPDPELLADAPPPHVWLVHRVLPWRMLAGQVVWVTDRAWGLEGTCRALGLEREAALFVEAETRAMDAALARRFGPRIARDAADALPAGESVRGLARLRARLAAGLAALAALWLPAAALLTPLAFLLLIVMNALTAGMRLAALTAASRHQPAVSAEVEEHGPAPCALADEPVEAPPAGPAGAALPRISLIVPLFREAGMVGPLSEALGRIDYPDDRLEVKLVVEADDAPTRRALEAAVLPPAWSVLVVPPGRPRTKPRALNYALAFCQGSIVGVLDAEDRPDPQQLRIVAAAFAGLPARYGCVQCRLAFHNA